MPKKSKSSSPPPDPPAQDSPPSRDQPPTDSSPPPMESRDQNPDPPTGSGLPETHGVTPKESGSPNPPDPQDSDLSQSVEVPTGTATEAYPTSSDDLNSFSQSQAAFGSQAEGDSARHPTQAEFVQSSQTSNGSIPQNSPSPSSMDRKSMYPFNSIQQWWDSFWNQWLLLWSPSPYWGGEYPPEQMEHLKNLVNDDAESAIKLLWKLQSEITELNKQIAQFNANPPRRNGYAPVQSQRVQTLEAENRNLKSSVQSLELRVRHLEVEQEKLQTEKATLQTQNRELETRCSKLMADMAGSRRDSLANPSSEKPQHTLLRSEFINLKNSTLRSISDDIFQCLLAANTTLDVRHKRQETPIILTFLGQIILVDGLLKLQNGTTEKETWCTAVETEVTAEICQYLYGQENQSQENPSPLPGSLQPSLTYLLESSHAFLTQVNAADPPGDLWMEDPGTLFCADTHAPYPSSFNFRMYQGIQI